MRSIYQTAWAVFRANSILFVGAALLSIAFEFLEIPVLVPVLSALLIAVLAYACHRAVLLDERYPWVRAFGHRTPPLVGPWPFVWRGLLFSGLFVLAERGAQIFLGGALNHEIREGLSLVVLLIAVGVLCFVGTLFPAAAIGADTSLSSAMARGRKTFWRTAWRLLIGPILFTLVLSLAAALGEAVAIEIITQSPVGARLLAVSAAPLAFVWLVASQVTILLGAIALCQSFEEAETILSKN